jgi:hypothetical protein
MTQPLIYDALVKKLGIDPTLGITQFPDVPLTKRRRHKLARLTERALTEAGFNPHPRGTTK